MRFGLHTHGQFVLHPACLRLTDADVFGLPTLLHRRLILSLEMSYVMMTPNLAETLCTEIEGN